MSANTVTITLTAKDGVSKVFTQIARDGEAMGTALKKAATDAERGLDDLGDSAQQAGRPLRDLKADAQNLGLGIGVLVSGMALAGKSFRDQEIALESMRRGYGDTAAEMERFAEQIQDTTNYSNDAAIASENIFRTLALNYQFSAEQIQQLITISADLAASMGIGLEDAAMRVQSAMRGEAESAEYLGLTLNDAALGIDNMAKSTSDAEKAQIRFNALQEQSAFALGMAQQQADTTYGTMTQLRDSVQDAAQSFGDFLGPLGEVGAFAADNVIQIAAMGLAIGQLGKAAVAINSLTTAFTGMSVASAAASVAIGPAGIAVGAAAAVVGVGLLVDYLHTSYSEELQNAINIAENLDETLAGLGGDAPPPIVQNAEEIANVFSIQLERMESYQKQRDELEKKLMDLGNAQTGLLYQQDQAALELNRQLVISTQAEIDALDQKIATLGFTQDAIAGNAEAQQALTDILNFNTDAQIMANEQLAYGVEQYKAGKWGIEELTRLVMTAAGQEAYYTEKIAERRENFNRVAGAMANDAALLGEEINVITQATEAESAYQKILAERTKHLDEGAIAMQEMADESVKLGSIYSQPLTAGGDDGSFDVQIQKTKDLAQEQAGLEAGIASAADAMSYQVDESRRLTAEMALQNAAVEKLEAQYAETFGQMQAAATQASDTLDTVFGAIVGNTDAIAKQSQSVMDWADGLIGAAGTVGEIDQLLADGAITLDEYTAAQAAYNDIAAANVSIQEDVLSIQAQLAPVVATANEALASQMDAIANGSTDAQLFALGMMDAATSSQALALAQGYLSDQDTFGPMLQQAAELNPMLAQILEEMGLISYNPATGEVRLLGAEEAQSEIELLTSAMDDLNETVATLIAVLDDQASGPMGDVQGLADALGITVATPTAVLNDLATGPLYAIQSLMGGLDGMTATTYVQTVYESVTSDTRFGAMADGGVIPAAAMGRVLNGATLVGEHGPELLLGGEGRGGMVVPATASSRTGNGWGGDVVVNVYGNVGVDDLTEQITAKLVPALQRAVGINNAAYGGFA